MASLILASTAVNCLAWPKPTIRPAIAWMDDSGMYPNACDEGASLDEYETEITVHAIQSELDTLTSTLDANREGITLSGMTTDIFAPNVNHSGSISASVIDPGFRAHKAFANVGAGVHAITIRLRALAPALVSATPTLAGLLLQPHWQGDHIRQVAKAFTYGNTLVANEVRADAGRFVGQFLQTQTQMQSILAYLLTTARGNSFVMPTWPRCTYPFGLTKGAGPFNVVAHSFKFSRASLSRWNLEIDFREAP